jgi:RNA polymerase sigma-70 factor (ECF subfamily)
LSRDSLTLCDNTHHRGFRIRNFGSASVALLRLFDPFCVGREQNTQRLGQFLATALACLAEIPDPFGEGERDDVPADSNDTASLISRALDQIRPDVEAHTWNAFWNTAVLGRSATEVAEDLGMTAMAVRQAKSRVLRRLRKQLGDG